MSEPPRPRAIAHLYNGAARAWVVAAIASPALPATARRGWWLPLHLLLMGGISTALSGNAQVLSAGLTATEPAPRIVVGSQFVSVTAGAALVATAGATGSRVLFAAGGSVFVLGIVILLGAIVRAWVRRRNARHVFAIAMYAVACGAVIAGGIVGAVLGAGGAGASFLALRRAHLALNILGWASLPIVGTLVTMLPATLRVRAPTFPVWPVGVSLVAGVAGVAAGVDRAGSILYAAGAVVLFGWVVGTFAVSRRWRAPAAAVHIGAANLWFVATCVALAIRPEPDIGIRSFEIALVVGWLGQTLLGAWLWLIPMQRRADPAARKRMLAAVDVGARMTAAVLNVGLALAVLAAADRLPTAGGRIGAIAAATAALVALAKTWLVPAARPRSQAATG